MQLEIRQVNTDNYQEDEVLDVLREAWYSFTKYTSDIDIVLERELNYFKNSHCPIQHFYLINSEKHEIVASLGIIIRDSTVPLKKNLVLSVVNTSEKYRKQGIMKRLINFVIALYENMPNKISGFSYSPDFVTQSNQFIQKYVQEGSFWTLYSAVKDFYSKFGFTSVKTLNYYTIPSKDLIDSKFTESFCILPGEELLTLENLETYLTQDEYLPNNNELSVESVRCCSFKCPSIMRFIYGNTFSFDKKNIHLPHNGLIIKSENGTTVFCIAHFFDPSKIIARRFFTDVTDMTILKTHLDRVYFYLCWYVNAFSIEPEHSSVYFAEGDIISNGKTGHVLDYLKEKNWIWDDSNSRFNPMLREWKGEEPIGTWKYNGFWCFS